MTRGSNLLILASLEPSKEVSFTTHAMSPGSVLSLCRDRCGKEDEAYVLAIRGYGWEFVERLTPEAEKNLEEAYRFLKARLRDLLNK
ncbi:MAG: hypothetical protein JW807_03915 [Spirochaetes bacterium]|nr:hypothetical protein [Spirochaetota bacterium]